MRALVCKEFGPPENLIVEDVPEPVAGPGQILISVAAACINFTDVLSTGGRSQLARELPMIPGVEAAGIVKALGAGVAGFSVGDRVLCQLMHGGFAERVVANADEVAKIPDFMTMEDASAFYIASFTTWHALFSRGALKAGESLLVLGAGSRWRCRVARAATEVERLLACACTASDCGCCSPRARRQWSCR